MKPSYSISYFILITAVVLAFVYAFAVNSEYQVENYVSIEESTPEESVNSNSDDVLSSGFFLHSDGTYVIVYLYDNVTIFLETDILISSLESTLQDEVKTGKYIETEGELYGFLENYSS